MLLMLEEEGHQPKNVGSFQKTEDKETDSPLTVSRGSMVLPKTDVIPLRLTSDF